MAGVLKNISQNVLLLSCREPVIPHARLHHYKII
jgi:hypothetical protein